MTKEELRALIHAAVEEKLFEMLGDPDEELEIWKAVRERLARQKRAVAAGERGRPLEDVVRELKLE
ncbi:MAG: hypothetical protein HYU88_02085 [Chloroflexi bacterium]|nr:hypothetical protein [Chloroflexota bacterium]